MTTTKRVECRCSQSPQYRAIRRLYYSNAYFSVISFIHFVSKVKTVRNVTCMFSRVDLILISFPRRFRCFTATIPKLNNYQLSYLSLLYNYELYFWAFQKVKQEEIMFGFGLKIVKTIKHFLNQRLL